MERAYTTCFKMTSIALSLILSPVLVHAESDNKMSFAIGSGFSVQNVYEGSSSYTGVLIPMVEMVAPTEVGKFTIAFPDGLRWDIPVGNTLGLALLGNYDFGRKENIRTLNGGHNRYLRGMGDLRGTAVAGIETSLNFQPGRIFVRGYKALRDRTYGGNDLGKTSYLEAGVDSALPLTNTLTMEMETYATWSDKDDMMSRFGVTSSQAQNSRFDRYTASGGLRSVTTQWGVNWQWTNDVSFGTGVRLTALTSDARKSPLVEKKVGSAWYVNGMYYF